MTDAAIEVTQEDREAAAYYKACTVGELADDNALVLAFATHRRNAVKAVLTAIASAQPVDTEGLVEAVAAAVEDLIPWSPGTESRRGFPDPHDIARAAISALSPRMDDVRREALEEAAKVAEEYRDPCLDDERDVNVAAASARACVDIATAIRSLSGSEGCD